MCPNTFFLNCLIVLAVSAAIYGRFRMYENAMSNLEFLARFLEQSAVTQRYLIYLSTTGHYKGRKVGLGYSILEKKNGASCSAVFVEPHGNLKKQPFFLLRYPKPTLKTELKGKRVYYVSPNSFKNVPAWSDAPTLLQSEVIDILEELTQAAEIVESNP